MHARPPSAAPSSRTRTSSAPRPVLTPAHSTVAVPVRAHAPPPDATARTPLTPAHVPAYPPPDREAASRDLAVQVLANQVQELSGLVRQVLDGDRGRRRGRSSSGRRSRSRRRDGPSSSRREVPSPRTPPRREVPPPRTPPRAPPRPARREPYDESRRPQLERELYNLLHEDDGTPYCWNINEEVLTWIVDSVRLWSNRDRTLWLCDPDLPSEVQQSMGIRVDIRIRSHIRNTMITG